MSQKNINEDTQITTNISFLLKVASSLFGILIVLFTVFYFDMVSRDKATNAKMDAAIESFENEVIEKLEKDRIKTDASQEEIRKYIFNIQRDINDILTGDRNSYNTEYNRSIQDPNNPDSNIPVP